MDLESNKPADVRQEKPELAPREAVFVKRPRDGRGVVIGTDYMHMAKRVPKPASDPKA